MLDFRWYVATLSAILIAFGIGILIGSAALGSNVWSTQEAQLVKDIENRLQVLRGQEQQRQAQLDALESQLAQSRAFAETAVAWIVEGRLRGRRVAVLSMDGRSMVPDVQRLLADAGAEVTMTGELQSDFAREQLAGVLGARATPEAAAARLGQALMAADVLTLEALAEAGFVQWSGPGPALPADGAPGSMGELAPPDSGWRNDVLVLLVGDTAQGQARWLQALVRAALAQGGHVVIGEASDAPDLTGRLASAPVALVDNADRPAGQVAIVLAATGRAGHYGVKPGAKALMPAPSPAGGSS